MKINRRSFVVRAALGVVAAAMAARDAFAGVFREIPFQPHVPPERYQDRLKYNLRERIWLKPWEAENNPHPALDHGIGPLDHCLDRVATPEERRAVAGVMQWFGSNCGHCFVEQVLRANGYRVTWDLSHPVWELADNDWGRRGPLPDKVMVIRHGGRDVQV